MSVSLLFPAALAGLLALLLPLLIHLARRQEHTPLPFAALRWLQLQARPQQRIRIREWPLLLLRMLLLALLVLLLAAPRWSGNASDPRPVVAVAAGLSADELPATLPAQAQRLWLAPGFPALGSSPAPTAAQPLSSLLRELDAQLPASTALTVVVPARLSGTDAQIPRLSRAVDWQVLADSDSAAARPPPPMPPQLLVRHDPQALGLRYLQALQLAWTPQQPLQIAPDSTALPPLQRGQVLVWLSAAPLPAGLLERLPAGVQVLLDARQPRAPGRARAALLRADDGQVLIERQAADAGQPALLYLGSALQPQSFPLLLQAEFPQRLREVLQPPPPPQLARASDHTPQAGARPSIPPLRDPTPWLIAVITALFALERWLATRRQRAALA